MSNNTIREISTDHRLYVHLRRMGLRYLIVQGDDESVIVTDGFVIVPLQGSHPLFRNKRLIPAISAGRPRFYSYDQDYQRYYDSHAADQKRLVPDLLQYWGGFVAAATIPLTAIPRTATDDQDIPAITLVAPDGEVTYLSRALVDLFPATGFWGSNTHSVSFQGRSYRHVLLGNDDGPLAGIAPVAPGSTFEATP